MPFAAVTAYVRDHFLASPAQGPTFLCARARGTRRLSAWHDGPGWAAALAGLASVYARHDRRADIDTLEFCFTHSFRQVDLTDPRGALAPVHRGIRGVEIHAGSHLIRYGPTELIAFNLDGLAAIEAAVERITNATGSSQVMAKVSVFEAHQLLVRVGDPTTITPMRRGDTPVRPEDVTAEALGRALDLMIEWFLNNLDPSGRLTYKYWPSRGEGSSEDNTIRQFMATGCLGQLATFTGRDDVSDAAVRNLRHNLDRFYQERDGLGLIAYDGTIKLGAIALAALAIRRSPRRAEFAGVEQSLLRAVDALWTRDGSFRTFFEPADRNDNHNFYPGEALLAWAEAYAESPDPELLSKFLKSVDYYQAWHHANRNPAFIPWHSQAYARLWDRTADPRLPPLVFAMNDWLVQMQEWDGLPYPDLQGRFYDPAHPDYGPPHASSTGVYLEGLADALRLARHHGEADRALTYETAIRRGLRDILQLQFRDDTSQFYITHRRRTHGGIRTEVYDNTLRVDNVQHCANAIMKYLGVNPE